MRFHFKLHFCSIKIFCLDSSIVLSFEIAPKLILEEKLKLKLFLRPLLVESSVTVIFYVIFLMRYAVIINY